MMGSVAVVTVLMGACIIAQVRCARLRAREPEEEDRVSGYNFMNHR
jgi:hypothetical protein